jgi:hypothetical protein
MAKNIFSLSPFLVFLVKISIFIIENGITDIDIDKNLSEKCSQWINM